MLLAVGGEPRSVEGIVPEAPDRASLALSDTSENDHVTDVVKDTKYWDSPSNATIKVLTPVPGDGPKKSIEKEGIPDMKEKPTRRLIKVDFSVLQDDDEDEDDENEVSERPEPPLRTSNGTCPSATPAVRTRATPLKDGPKSPRSPPKPAPRTHWTHRTAYDLATQCPTRRASFRRHTLSTSAALSLDCGAGSRSVPQSRPSSRQSTCSSADLLESSGIAWSRGSIQDDLMNSQQWHEAMSLDDRLSLTLEEIVHIRSVLTKAELEALPVEGRVKEDVERRKVCFLCLKTRFGIFGPWGQRCRLCKRTVCQRCYTKMRIPTEHFSNVPVVLLSPSLMSSPEEEVKESFPRSLVNRLMPEESTPTHTNSVGSAPNSPSLQRSNVMTCSAPPSRLENYLDQAPSPARSTTSERRAPVRSNKLNSKGVGDKIRGVQMIVCHDCKIMVIQIIRSSRTSRSAIRNNAIRNLTLNISPVY